MLSGMFIDRIHEIILVRMARLHTAEGLLSALLQKEIVDILRLLRSIRVHERLDGIQLRRHIWLDKLHSEGESDLVSCVLMLLEAGNRTLGNHQGISLSVFLQ